MRKVGQLADARRAGLFGDFLTSVSIENQVRETGDGNFAIWICRERQVVEAGTHFKSFCEASQEAKYLKGQRQTKADQRARLTLEQTHQRRKRKIEAAEKSSGNSVGLATSFVLILTVGVAIWTGLGLTDGSEARMAPLKISTVVGTAMPEIAAGQVWRLLSPVFLHFDFMHIGFNLMAFVFLGQMIEKRSGTLVLMALFLLSGVGSNVAQYFVSGPQFGGLSGVAYALFGYVWMKSRLDPFSGYFLADQTVTFALVWLAVCFTGLLGPIANTAHVVGLAVGLVWGVAAAKIRR